MSQGKLQSLGQPNFSQGISQQGMSQGGQQSQIGQFGGFGSPAPIKANTPQSGSLNPTYRHIYKNIPN